VLRNLAGLATPMALRVAVTLDLPDRFRNGATIDEVAPELEVSPVGLRLLVEHLLAVGIVERTSAGYRTTGFGANLSPHADNGLVNLLHLDSAIGRAELAFVELAHSVTTGQAGYPRRYGTEFWADLDAHPTLRESFDQQMTHRLHTQIPDIVDGFDWGGFTTIVDVGGGHGSLLAAILHAHPHLRGHLVDVESTAAAARRTFHDQGLDERTHVSAASFFDPLPAGADAYLLCDILHDWDDEHAHKILHRCTQAARPTSRILIIEPVGGKRSTSDIDLAMLVFFGGRERRLEEFRALADAHGMILKAVSELADRRCLLEFAFTDQITDHG
jgi:2,7-dihydroxy-5-methyl-1-naphthoate 7-O-methyltransferase